VGIDSIIHRRFGVAGYGPIIGAGVSNWLADAIATIPEGVHATAGITVGTLIPLTPFGVYIFMRHSFSLSKPPRLLVGVIVASIFSIFAHEYRHSAKRLYGRMTGKPEDPLKEVTEHKNEL